MRGSFLQELRTLISGKLHPSSFQSHSDAPTSEAFSGVLFIELWIRWVSAFHFLCGAVGQRFMEFCMLLQDAALLGVSRDVMCWSRLAVEQTGDDQRGGEQERDGFQWLNSADGIISEVCD